MYTKQKNYDLAEQDYLKTIQMDDKDPEGYYYLALLYEIQRKDFKALTNYTKAIDKIEADLGYYISDDFGKELSFSSVYMKRGGLYERVQEYELMCEDYKKACELEKCNNLIPEGKELIYNEHCK